MQINTQIDDSYQQKIAAIHETTQLNTPEIIKQALDLLYEKTALTGRQKNRMLLEMLAGTAEGSEDLSINYKDYLLEGWKEKHGID